jgi:hypothetical protein
LYITNLAIRASEEKDQDLDWYSNSKLVAIDTCERWGAIRFGARKTMAAGGRSMPLEAGSAAHDGFAALRLFMLGKLQNLPDHMRHHAARLYGELRAEEILSHFDKHPDNDTIMLNMVLSALHTSDFYDDPRDKRRTLANIEESLIAYCRRYPFDNNEIWVEDKSDPTKLVGIEIFFDHVVTVKYKVSLELIDEKEVAARFIGTLDGLHVKVSENSLRVEENKTASRLDDAWRNSWETNHQPTGYMLSATVFTHQAVSKGVVRGMQIPLPKTYDLGGIVNEPIKRTDEMFLEWAKWFASGVEKYRRLQDNPLASVMNTHSCNRYFRPCSLIPLCASERDEQQEMLEMMEDTQLSPSEEAMETKAGD